MADKEVWLALGLGLPLLLLAWVYYYSLSLQKSRSQGGVTCKVPPGKFWQLPILGESIPFITCSSTKDFMRPRLNKYGRVFRTHLLGGPAICVTSVDSTKFVLQSPSLFKGSHTAAVLSLFGTKGIHTVEGEVHARYRKIVRSTITSAALKSFAAHVDQLAKQFSKGKTDQAVIQGHSEYLRYTLGVAMLVCCDHVKLETDDFLKDFLAMEEGFIGFPINLPGTKYSKALKAREKIQEFLRQQIQIRRQEKGSVVHNDLLDSFLNFQGPDGSKLTEDQVIDNLQFVLLGGHETTSNIMSWTYRNLLLHPKILELVKAENDALAQSRKHVDDPISVEELKELPLSTKFIQETMRMTSTVDFVWREAKEDVIYDGMLFPKGWRVFTWFTISHFDPENHANPNEFNPWRFETQPKANTWTPFGNGYRICPGMDLAMAEMLIFLHRFLTTYDFEATGDLHNIKQWPMPHMVDGLPLRISKRNGKA